MSGYFDSQNAPYVQALYEEFTRNPEAVHPEWREFFRTRSDDLPEAGLYERIVREVERPLIEHCLAATNGNQIRSAEILGLNRNTLRKKIRYLEIPVVRGLR